MDFEKVVVHENKIWGPIKTTDFGETLPKQWGGGGIYVWDINMD